MKKQVSKFVLSLALVVGLFTSAMAWNETKQSTVYWNSGSATFTTTVDKSGNSMTLIDYYWTCRGLGYSITPTGVTVINIPDGKRYRSSVQFHFANVDSAGWYTAENCHYY